MKTKQIFTGGYRIGKSYLLSMNATYPFARLSISDKVCLEINFIFVKKIYIFKFDDIISVKVKKGIFSKGLQLNHKNLDYPKFIIFWSADIEYISMLFKQNRVFLIDRVEENRERNIKFAKKAMLIYMLTIITIFISFVLYDMLKIA